jgi:hypothetical protein
MEWSAREVLVTLEFRVAVIRADAVPLWKSTKHATRLVARRGRPLGWHNLGYCGVSSTTKTLVVRIRSH